MEQKWELAAGPFCHQIHTAIQCDIVSRFLLDLVELLFLLVVLPVLGFTLPNFIIPSILSCMRAITLVSNSMAWSDLLNLALYSSLIFAQLYYNFSISWIFTRIAFFMRVSDPVYSCFDLVYLHEGRSRKLLREVRGGDGTFLFRQVSMTKGLSGPSYIEFFVIFFCDGLSGLVGSEQLIQSRLENLSCIFDDSPTILNSFQISCSQLVTLIIRQSMLSLRLVTILFNSSTVAIQIIVNFSLLSLLNWQNQLFIADALMPAVLFRVIILNQNGISYILREILRYNNSQIRKNLKMAHPVFVDEENDLLNDPQYVPIEYKIVDLPIIQIPSMNTLKTYPCKIYKKIIFDNQATVAQPVYEWKRRCHGRVKFVQVDDSIVVAAYEYGSCHNRLKEQPITHDSFYNLSESQEFAYNWVFVNNQEETISIALTSEGDFMEFKTEWENAKIVNNVKLSMQQVQGNEESEGWLGQIDDSIFM